MKRKTVLTGMMFILLALMAVSFQPAYSETISKEVVFETAETILMKENTYALSEYINGISKDKLAVAKMYNMLAKRYYFKFKDLPASVMIARTGIDYCLYHARALKGRDEEKRKRFLSHAKTIAYNLGANTWPGRNDVGITIDKTSLAMGRDAAKLNLKLAEELDKPDDKMANAHWLMGAHYIAIRHNAKAVKNFKQAIEYAKKAKDDATEQMCRGYMGIALIQGGKDPRVGVRHFNDAVKELEKMGTKKAKSFAEQLKSVKTVMEVYFKYRAR